MRLACPIVIVLAFVAFLAACGGAPEAGEARAVADATVRAVVPGWDREELGRRMAPPPYASVSPTELDSLFDAYEARLGPVTSIGEAWGTVTTQAHPAEPDVQRPVAFFSVPLAFAREAGEASVSLMHDDGEWLLVGFSVWSDAWREEHEAP